MPISLQLARDRVLNRRMAIAFICVLGFIKGFEYIDENKVRKFRPLAATKQNHAYEWSAPSGNLSLKRVVLQKAGEVIS
jgi:hypothetical protein